MPYGSTVSQLSAIRQAMRVAGVCSPCGGDRRLRRPAAHDNLVNISIATGFKGGAYELFAKQYRETLAREHVALNIRSTDGTWKNYGFWRIGSLAFRSRLCRASRMTNKHRACCHWGASTI